MYDATYLGFQHGVVLFLVVISINVEIPVGRLTQLTSKRLQSTTTTIYVHSELFSVTRDTEASLTCQQCAS